MKPATNTLAREVIEAMRSVVPEGGPLHAPTLEGNAWRFLHREG